jgi:hypothetical protein
VVVHWDQIDDDGGEPVRPAKPQCPDRGSRATGEQKMVVASPSLAAMAIIAVTSIVRMISKS